jgi:hypothetical protein
MRYLKLFRTVVGMMLLAGGLSAQPWSRLSDALPDADTRTFYSGSASHARVLGSPHGRTFIWDGTDNTGRQTGPGVYAIETESGRASRAGP